MEFGGRSCCISVRIMCCSVQKQPINSRAARGGRQSGTTPGEVAAPLLGLEGAVKENERVRVEVSLQRVLCWCSARSDAAGFWLRTPVKLGFFSWSPVNLWTAPCVRVAGAGERGVFGRGFPCE